MVANFYLPQAKAQAEFERIRIETQLEQRKHFLIRVKFLQALSFMSELYYCYTFSMSAVVFQPVFYECFKLLSCNFEDDELTVLNCFERVLISTQTILNQKKDCSSRIDLNFQNCETNHCGGWHARLNSVCYGSNQMKSKMGLVRLDSSNYQTGGKRKLSSYVKIPQKAAKPLPEQSTKLR